MSKSRLNGRDSVAPNSQHPATLECPRDPINLEGRREELARGLGRVGRRLARTDRKGNYLDTEGALRLEVQTVTEALETVGLHLVLIRRLLRLARKIKRLEAEQ